MSTQVTNQTLLQVIKTYWTWRILWIGTTVAFGVFGLGYVLLVKNDLWVASQGLIVRDEANGAVMRLGRFESQAEMKAAQETILEMARNTQVIRDALRKVGPQPSWFRWTSKDKYRPSSGEIESFADSAINVHAPKGAQFGTTEVIYLDIKQDSRERAVAMNRSICESLEHRLQIVRKARADGVITELLHARDTAKQQLGQATEQLQLIERDAGADLSDLRGMTDSNSGGNTNLQQLDSLKSEIRQAEYQQQQLLTDLNLLRESLQDPAQLSFAPSTLLQAQPGLKRLREGMADAQLAVSQLQGKYQASHPLVISAENAKMEIASQLQQELLASLQAVERDADIGQKRIDQLKNQQHQSEARLERLARVRADYGNLVSEVRTRSTILQDAERKLAEAQASCDAALSTSLLTRLDEPVLGERPVGPSRTTILGGTTFAGLFFGLGIVFLLTPLDSTLNFGRRANDLHKGFGRRLTDRFPWLASGRAETQNCQQPESPACTSPNSQAHAKQPHEAVKPNPQHPLNSLQEELAKLIAESVALDDIPSKPSAPAVVDQSFEPAESDVASWEQTVQIERAEKHGAQVPEPVQSLDNSETPQATEVGDCEKTMVRSIIIKNLDEATPKFSLNVRAAVAPEQALDRRNKPREEPSRTFKPVHSKNV